MTADALSDAVCFPSSATLLCALRWGCLLKGNSLLRSPPGGHPAGGTAKSSQQSPNFCRAISKEWTTRLLGALATILTPRKQRVIDYSGEPVYFWTSNSIQFLIYCNRVTTWSNPDIRWAVGKIQRKVSRQMLNTRSALGLTTGKPKYTHHT